MKKLLAGFLASFLMASALVALTGTTAEARKCNVYTGCTFTDTQLKAFSPKPRKMRAIAGVSARGNARPGGSIKIKVKGNGKYRQKVRTAPKAKVSFKLPPGLYLVEAKYIPGRSPFLRSDEATIVRVKGRRR